MTLSLYYEGSNVVILKWAEMRYTYQISWCDLIVCLWSRGTMQAITQNALLRCSERFDNST